MNRKVVFIRHRSKHHAANSGYSRLIDFYPGCDYLPKDTDSYVVPHAIGQLFTRKIVDKTKGAYNVESIRKEIALVRYMRNEKHGIAHFLNGERDIRYSLRFKESNDWKFVATFHKPPSVLKKNILDYKYLRRLNGAITVGTNQVGYLKEKLHTDKVAYIPHGVDTGFFVPKDKPENFEEHTALFVGYHLRDIETLVATAEIIKKKFPKFKLKVVMGKAYFNLFPQSDTFEFYPGIPDEELRTLYQTSSVLLMPLKDSTANNAVLEGMACGLPTVTTDSGSISDYVSKGTGIITREKDSKGLADATIYLMENPEANMKMRLQSRVESDAFSWETVASLMKKQYEQWFS